jgi:hypothetical protein
MWLTEEPLATVWFQQAASGQKGQRRDHHLQYSVTNLQQGRTMPICTVQLALGISGLSGRSPRGEWRLNRSRQGILGRVSKRAPSGPMT